MTAPEFHRPERIDTIGDAARTIRITASEDERTALARRFDLVTLDRLEAEFDVRRAAAGIAVEGIVRATLAQACSVTGEPLPVTLDEPVALLFVQERAPDADEVELSGDALDVMFYHGGAIDLGEAAAETVALALEPFPRGPGAQAALAAAGVLSEEQAGPFGALAGLRDALKDQ